MKKIIVYVLSLIFVFSAGYFVSTIVNNKSALSHTASAGSADDGHGHDECAEEEHEDEHGILEISAESQKLAGIRIKKFMPERFVKTISATGQVSQDAGKLHEVKSPYQGIVEKCGVSAGEHIAAGVVLCTVKTAHGDVEVISEMAGTIMGDSLPAGSKVNLFTALHFIADMSNLEAVFDVSEKDIGGISIGQAVKARSGAYQNLEFPGTVIFISPYVDPSTRAVKVRAGLSNQGGKLKLGMFLEGEFIIKSQAEVIVLPQDVSQFSDGKRIAFVRTGDENFEMRYLGVLDESAGHIAVASGIESGEEVVTSGGFLLKSEVFKSKMGAGCAD